MAADGVNFQMNGLPELLGKLDALDNDIKKKGGRFALRKAAQVLRKQAQANAERVDDPMTESRIAKNIVERWSGRTFKRTGNLMFRIGVLGGAKRGETAHWRFLEFGTEKMRAQPIFRPVPGQVGQQATDEFISQYSKKIDRVLKSAKKKAGK